MFALTGIPSPILSSLPSASYNQDQPPDPSGTSAGAASAFTESGALWLARGQCGAAGAAAAASASPWASQVQRRCQLDHRRVMIDLSFDWLWARCCVRYVRTYVCFAYFLCCFVLESPVAFHRFIVFTASHIRICVYGGSSACTVPYAGDGLDVRGSAYIFSAGTAARRTHAVGPKGPQGASDFKLRRLRVGSTRFPAT